MLKLKVGIEKEIPKKEVEIKMVKKGTPKRDGSGKGRRANRGRGGCKPTRKKGRGK